MVQESGLRPVDPPAEEYSGASALYIFLHSCATFSLSSSEFCVPGCVDSKWQCKGKFGRGKILAVHWQSAMAITGNMA